MRNNHEGMPQMVKTIEEEGAYFGIVRVTREEWDHFYKIGLSPDEAKAWRKVLSTFPYDTLNRNPCRYFFSGAGRHHDKRPYARIRIEQEEEGREFEIDLPERVVANLVWFMQMKNPFAAQLLLYKE